ncbi:hypothetical protein MKX03_035771 [Papaver bracteatum]|nr:hypothetical protein MKX03_035771 [Papaver bracteatum]
MMIQKKTQHLIISKVIEYGNDGEEPGDVEIKVPELNAKDAKKWSGGALTDLVCTCV